MAQLDPLLMQIQKKVEAGVPKDLEADYHKIMAAGKKLMFSEQTYGMMNDYMKTIRGLQDVPDKVSHGIVKAISILFNESQGSMSLPAAGPASIMLMVDTLQYVEEVLGIDVDKPTIDQTTTLTKDGFVAFVKQASKISDEDWNKLQQGGAAPAPEPGSAAPVQPPVGALQE